MTARQFAMEMNINYFTALRWLRTNRVPGAKWVESPIGSYWEIPKSAISKTVRPKKGPKNALQRQRSNYQ